MASILAVNHCLLQPEKGEQVRRSVVGIVVYLAVSGSLTSVVWKESSSSARNSVVALMPHFNSLNLRPRLKFF